MRRLGQRERRGGLAEQARQVRRTAERKTKAYTANYLASKTTDTQQLS